MPIAFNKKSSFEHVFIKIEKLLRKKHGFDFDLIKLKTSFANCFGYKSYKIMLKNSMDVKANSKNQMIYEKLTKEKKHIIHNDILVSIYDVLEPSSDDFISRFYSFSLDYWAIYNTSFFAIFEKNTKHNQCNSITHPIATLRKHSIFDFSISHGLDVWFGMYDKLLNRSTSTTWIINSRNEERIQSGISYRSNLLSNEFIISKGMLNTSEIDFLLFMKNYDLMLDAIKSPSPLVKSSGYLAKILVELLETEFNKCKNIDHVKKVININYILEKIHDPQYGVIYWEFKNKFYSFISVDSDGTQIPRYVITNLDYMMGTIHNMADAYFNLFSDESIITIEELYPENSHTIIRYMDIHESALACLFLHQSMKIRMSKKVTSDIVIILEQPDDSTHGMFGKKLKEFSEAKMYFSFFNSLPISKNNSESNAEKLLREEGCDVFVEYVDKHFLCKSTYASSTTEGGVIMLHTYN